MVKCPKCGSTQTKIEEGKGDFANIKPEGEQSNKQRNDFSKESYFCWDCEYKWEETKES